MVLPDYNNHICPECGHKIGIHSDSPFGHNPTWRHPLSYELLECGRSRHSLIIEKLTAWLNDAINERDAYMESYDKVCKERDAFFDNGVEKAQEIKNLKKLLELALTHDSQSYPTSYAYEAVCDALEKTRRKLDIATDALKWFINQYQNVADYPISDTFAEEALSKIEEIK